MTASECGQIMHIIQTLAMYLITPKTELQFDLPYNLNTYDVSNVGVCGIEMYNRYNLKNSGRNTCIQLH